MKNKRINFCIENELHEELEKLLCKYHLQMQWLVRYWIANFLIETEGRKFSVERRFIKRLIAANETHMKVEMNRNTYQELRGRCANYKCVPSLLRHIVQEEIKRNRHLDSLGLILTPKHGDYMRLTLPEPVLKRVPFYD